ncbi:MAG: recombinase XerD [Hydrogenophilales bacterium CG17_big_fil_post_rev_8_21_14_2_50_63_12]|nr:MAG: recombinase XerD [Hydrogenophilales bacterium CG17_big_fil_post_rev_8_21_14_2_50_63_12]
MASLKFTKTALLAQIAPEEGKRLTIYDADIPKLALRMTHAGTKTFYVVKRAGSTMAWVKLGTFPEMTVEKARAEAQKVLGEFATGSNPAEARRAFKAMLTLSELFAEYGARHGSKKLAWRDDQQRFRDYLEKSLGNKKLSAITRADLARILSDAEKAGKAVATVRAIRALASIIFAKGIEWGHLETNPAQGVKISGKKVTRDRFLQSDEMPRFFAALAEESSVTMRDFILLALLTGARRANLCAMHWQEIDLGAGVWRIPRTKNDEPQSVTLCPEAVVILEARKEATGGGFVFPGTGETGHIVEPRKAVERVMDRAGIPFGRNVPNGVTLHDLRRTLGSWQARAGASLAIIGKSLNHKSQAATAIYARLDLGPVRQSVNAATSAMLVAGEVKDSADVVKINRKA